MRNQDMQKSALDVALYEEAQGQIHEFKSKMPTASVEQLAREVIRRLAERDDDISIDAPTDDQIESLCLALLDDDNQAGAAFILEARSAGASIDAVYLKYLARAARMLGEWWDTDKVAFHQVAVGTSRMYAIMRAMRHQMPYTNPSVTRSAIFVSVPGETHTLGVRMAADLFRKEGWDIDLQIDDDHDSLVSYLVESDAALIGISAGGQHSLPALSRLIVALRIKMPGTALFVSGQITQEAADAINLIGVDGMVNDIDAAKALMIDLWDGLQRQ